MRVTAKPAQATQVIDVGASPSTPPTGAPPASGSPHPPVPDAEAPRLPAWGPRLILAAAAVVSVVGGSLFLVVDALTGPTSGPTVRRRVARSAALRAPGCRGVQLRAGHPAAPRPIRRCPLRRPP
jgi:hypothetical protein